MKKTTVFSFALAACIVVGTTAVFAASAFDDDFKSDAETIETETSVVTYVRDDDKKAYYILDDGRTLDEAEYEKEYPVSDIEWWTYEEYKDWLEIQKQELPKLIGAKGKANGKEFVWTQEMVDKAIAQYEEELQEIKNGAMVSKPKIDGEGNTMGITINNTSNSSQTSQMYQLCLANGEEHVFGPYETKEELLAVVEPFCKTQVALGNMEQAEADMLLGKLTAK